MQISDTQDGRDLQWLRLFNTSQPRQLIDYGVARRNTDEGLSFDGRLDRQKNPIPE